MESPGKSKKRITLGENHQAELRSKNTTENDRELSTDFTESYNKFSVDYCKKGTAKCKKCKKLISKDNLRIGKRVPFKVGYIRQYFHVKCAFISFRKARHVSNIIQEITEVDGVDTIPGVAVN